MNLRLKFKDRISALSNEDLDRMIRMGWEDRTTFEAIQLQFGFNENQFIRIMRSQLSTAAFLRWRQRVHQQGHTADR